MTVLINDKPLCPHNRKEAVNPRCRIVGHFYHELYEPWLARFRNERIGFLEIGIGQGHSIPVFEEYFKKADLHFMDIACQGDLSRHPPRFKQLYESQIALL